MGSLGLIEQQQTLLLEKGPNRISPFMIPMIITNMAPGHVAISLGIKGPNMCTTSACASGAHGIGEAFRMVQRGEADLMFAGGSGHTSRQGHSFDQRFAAYAEATLLYRARGENAASERQKGPVDEAKAKALFQLWLESGGHRRNLMKRDYEFVSTGVIQRGDELWAVQIFWSKPIPPNSNPLVSGFGIQ